MNNFFISLKSLRKYFFLKVIVWVTVITLIYEHNFLGLFSHSPIKDIDDFYYFDYLDDLFFSFYLFTAFSFVMFFIEYFIHFLIKKFILKHNNKTVQKHKNKFLNILDNIYTVFFIIMLIYAFLKASIVLFSFFLFSLDNFLNNLIIPYLESGKF